MSHNIESRLIECRRRGCPPESDQSGDGVIDVVVSDHTGVAGDTVVGLDVVEGLYIPGGGEFEGTVDLIETSDQVLIHGAGATGHEAVGDHAEVVADVTGALGLAAGVGGVVGSLHLGGVGELVVDGLGGAVHQGVGVGGEGLGGLQGVLGALEATEGGVELRVAEEAALGIGGWDGLGVGRLLWGGVGEKGKRS